MKTKTAPLTFAKGAKRITCTSSDVKDGFGKVVWFDENGDPYELEYSKISRRWAFMPYKKGSFEQPK